ncbi:MAG: undecaprenyl-diphosphate phosphatase [Candidatus Korarchaeum sp.]|nr:undecaprenyl-diphosphate phosphatase [Candidatus Korarchaeum sp.]MDW8035375.1 undecaprenyl-diphosphate phosphatase [Candidatus Korarchaeum sp.]
MDLKEALLLGALQGLTEWLPISSSAHILILQELLSSRSVLFNAVVHGGTLLSVLIVFRADVIAIIKGFLRSLTLVRANENLDLSYESKLAWCVLIGTLPAASVGLLLADQIEAAFTKLVAALGLLVNSLVLYSTKWARGSSHLDLKRALLIGLVQSVSLMPGISRSGSTIAAGLLTGMRREEAMRFSFLLSVPTIAGALILEVLRSPWSEVLSLTNVAGFLSSFLVGLAAIRFLTSAVRRGKLHWFSYYCFPLGIVTLLMSFS